MDSCVLKDKTSILKEIFSATWVGIYKLANEYWY